jgi:hypothetical protein
VKGTAETEIIQGYMVMSVNVHEWPKERKTKEQTMMYKTLHKKTEDRTPRTPLKTGGRRWC